MSTRPPTLVLIDVLATAVAVRPDADHLEWPGR
jgi:hypothetical protein